LAAFLKRKSGAPASMKIDTTPSPWRYEAARHRAVALADLRQPTITHHASPCPEIGDPCLLGSLPDSKFFCDGEMVNLLVVGHFE
jgi:hypothetical protein